MANLKTLEREYLGRRFVDGGGITTEEYEEFQASYINYLRSLCKKNGWSLVNVGKSHYEFSVFIKDENDNCVYLRISDVRYFYNEWYKHILIRGAKNEKDYTGFSNGYTSLPKAEADIKRILNFLERRKGNVI